MITKLAALSEVVKQGNQEQAVNLVREALAEGMPAVDILENYPEIGHKVPEANDPNIRELIFQNYRIMYRMHHEVVQIIAVIRGSRDINKWPLKPWEII